MAGLAIASSVLGTNADIRAENKRLKRQARASGTRKGELDAVINFKQDELNKDVGNVTRMSAYQKLKIKSEALKTERGIEASAAVSGTSGGSVVATLNQANYNEAVSLKNANTALTAGIDKIKAASTGLEITRLQETDRINYGDVGGGQNQDLAKHALAGISAGIGAL